MALKPQSTSQCDVSSPKKFERLMLGIPEVVNVDTVSHFEVKPGLYSPVFVNLKNALHNVEFRSAVVKHLSIIIGMRYALICGVESGGSYYASSLADLLSKPLILLRKTAKPYGEEGRIVGALPSQSQRVALVDDVLATGRDLTEAVALFADLRCTLDYYCIFSYGLDQQLERRLNVHVASLANIYDLCDLAIGLGSMLKSDADYITAWLTSRLGVNK